MLKFFRRIRQKLLSENRFSKYVLYAIGEIILVVIGILIAIQINNWNETRKDRKAENKALVNLKKEFDKNQKSLESLVNVKKSIEDYCRNYLELISNDTLPLSKKIDLPLPSQYSAVWNVNISVLNSLLSTGGIDRIKNDSLRFLLTSWPGDIESFKGNEVQYINRLNLWASYMDSIVPRPLVKKGDYGDWPGSYFPNKIGEAAKTQMAILVNDIKHYNHLSKMMSSLYTNLLIARRISENYQRITQLIEIELKDRKVEFSDE